jgi:threonine synthase
MAVLICLKCNREYPYSSLFWRCPSCADKLDISYERPFSTDLINADDFTIWRYREFLPPIANVVSLGEGWTPIVARRCRKIEILFKLDYLMPSGSFKDRGTSVAISRAVDLGVKDIVEDSSGNAGISISLYSNTAGLHASIYVPKDIPEGKLGILKSLGSDAILSESRLDAHKDAVRASKGAYYIGHLWNPFFIEGFKTFAYEAWEQLQGRLPRYIFIPVGSGSNLIGIYRGCVDLLRAGCIDELPMFIAVEAAGYDPLYRKFHGDPGLEKTEFADGLRVLDKPRIDEVANIIDDNGDVVVVAEDEIRSALKELWRLGFAVEPTSSAVYAGIIKAYKEKLLDVSEPVLAPLTGSGLKFNIS